jgi:hypothetical protein
LSQDSRQNSLRISLSPHSCHMLNPFYSPSFYHRIIFDEDDRS